MHKMHSINPNPRLFCWGHPQSSKILQFWVEKLDSPESLKNVWKIFLEGVPTFTILQNPAISAITLRQCEWHS